MIRSWTGNDQTPRSSRLSRVSKQQTRNVTVVLITAAVGVAIGLGLVFGTSGGHVQGGSIVIVLLIAAVTFGLIWYANYRYFRKRRNTDV